MTANHTDNDGGRHAAAPSPAVDARLVRIRELEGALEAASVDLQRLHDEREATAGELARYRELFDFAPLPLLVLNRAGIIVQLNLAAASLFGTPRAAVEGRPLLGFVTTESKATLLEHLRLCRRGELPSRTEVALHEHDDRNPLSVEIHSHCRDGDTERLFTTLIDLSDRKRAEAEHCRAVESDAIATALDRFLALVSHELRTPLTPIANLVEVLQLRQEFPDALRPILQTMQRNVWMEVRLIDDLLDITRIRRDKLSIDRETVDLHEVLRNVEDMLGDEFHAAGVDLSLDLAAAETRLQGDLTRLNQVFWNLLGNARKFTPSGGEVRVHTFNPAPDRVKVLVEDTGLGMQPSDIERLFRPFEQVRAGYRKGLGLGLAITRGIVEGHHGTIDARSDGPGKGSVFSVTLPLDG